MKISLLVPTRQRPERLKALYQSAMEHADNPEDIELVAYIDDDDQSYDNLDLPRLFKVLGPRIVLSEAWNECWNYADGEILWHGGDDNLFRTKGWDTVVVEAFEKYPDRILFAYGDDGNPASKANKFGTHGFIHKNWTDITDRFVPPYFVSDYNDTWFNDVAKKIGRHEHIPVLIEHMHYSLGKSDVDDNTRERLARHEKEDPAALYNSAEKQNERQHEADMLQSFITDFGKVKWSICILTVPERVKDFTRIKGILEAQIDGRQIELLVNDKPGSLGEKRQWCLDNAKGKYINFVDDDDIVAHDYVDTIYPLLDGVDYIGFQLQLYEDGAKQKPTFHNLRYKEWSDDDKGFYRNVSHLNPIRIDIARQARFDGGIGEDYRWAQQVKPKKQHYINRPMYFYFHAKKYSLALEGK